ncbi:MAG: NfeD family protein [Rhodospirillaceae bacterium]|jgi:inner membrane protein|nr:NfeD family protein [Rhodospirillaceae bacterium]
MEAFLESLDFWSWWILALLLFVLELSAPGVVFLFIAVAAAITGVVAWVLPDLGWQISFVVFALLSVVSVVVGRKVWRPGKVETADPTLNRRANQYVGKTFTLDTAVKNGRGRLNVGDSSWLAKGPDLPAGTKVRVTAVDGSILEIEAAE